MKRIFEVIEKYFFIIILLAVAISLVYPNSFKWVLSEYNGINIINLLLSIILFTMGTTLKADDFINVIKNPKAITVGISAQYVIMPLMALALASAFSLDTALTIGLILVGTVPGGIASDVITFIANGDVARLEKIGKYEERYGLKFASATLSFGDYNNVEIDAKIILDTLSSVTPALDQEQHRMLFDGVYADYEHIKTKKKRMDAVREDIYFNALQIKYAAAITGHKSQGGQWKCVFIHNPFWRDEISLDEKKWLYTAITRGVERVYLVNFKDNFFNNK